MQVFASCKAIANGMVLQLNCFKRKYRIAVRIMKLTAIILLAACLQLSARGISQTITLSVKDASLQKVFREIERQTDYTFFADMQFLKNAKKVTIVANGLPLNQVLDLCFKDQLFTYSIAGKTITLKPKNDKADKTSLNQGELIDLKGQVINENNDPVEGVNVTVQGTSIVTTTNVSGEFSLKGIDENATLVFTSVNMETFEVRIKGRTFLDVALQTKITSMQEVVINKGYYTEKKRLATGNVVTVKAKDIENQPVNNPLLALVGRVPGVTIEQQTGYSNSGVVVRIQGTNSIASGLEPLYIIDGVPYLSQTLPSASGNILGGAGGVGTALPGNPLSLINSNDIESIDILKDADATAIYGSRGANGVILITTKKGKAGQTRINANFRSGWGKAPRRIDLLNTEQYLAMRKEAFVNAGQPVPDQTTTPNNSNYDLTVWDQNRYTDWQEVLFGGTANYADAQASISGGTANTQFLISTGYHKETTVFPGDFSDQKGSFQFNINHSSNSQKFRVQASGLYVVDNNQLPTIELTSTALKLAPNAPALYNADGTLNWAPLPNGNSTWTNPIAYLNNRYQNKANNLIGSLQLSYQILKGLKILSRFGYNNQQYDEIYTYPLAAVLPENRSSSSRISIFGNGNTNGWIIEPQATYEVNIGPGKLEALIGTTFQKTTTKSNPVVAIGYSSDLLMNSLSAAPTVIPVNSIYSLYNYNALFGRINYNYKDRYIINTTARRDGSSRFGSENLFNNFWGIAGSWIFTNEQWLLNKSGFLTFGKLRASYGTSGNEQIGEYGFMSLYNNVSAQVAYQGITSLAPNRHTNPYLQWEETNKLQFGLDLGFWNDRINFSGNYYRNRSSNLLLRHSLSIITGFDNIIENFEGVLENSGWEFALTTYNIRTRNFTWTTSLNLTIPQHNGQLISFPDLASSVYANSFSIGKSINDNRRYQFLGVDPNTGIYQFQDSKGNSTFTPTVIDLIAISNTTQKLFGGLQNNVTYKNFSLDFTFQAVKRDARMYYGETPGTFTGTGNKGNQPVLIESRWKATGDVQSVQKITTSYSGSVNTGYNSFNNSDGPFTDASFIRLTNLSFSWQLPTKWSKRARLQNARLFAQGQNLFMITKYKGLDASTGSGTSDASLPPLRVITLGASITL